MNTETSAVSMPCTYHEFREAAAIFWRDMNEKDDLSQDQLENGNKCLGLMYFGMTDYDDLTDHELNDCIMILEISTKKMFEYMWERCNE